MFYKETFVLLLLIVGIAFSAPPTKRESFGPCIGMDCMHGVLMHGDDHAGEGHAAEDTFNRLQAADALKGKESGPKEGMEFLHGVLMHNDEKPGEDHEHKTEQKKLGPLEKPEQEGPCQGMDCLHGILMHGDGEQGADHGREDAKKIQKDKALGKDVKKGPCKGMDCMHGVLMHGDGEAGIDHAQEHAQLNRKEENVRSGVENPDRYLHEEGADHEDVHVEEVEDEMEGVDDAPAVAAAAEEDFEDYAQWKKEHLKEKASEGTLWGFSLPFISDGDSDTDFMKWKYLAKLLSRGGDDDSDGKTDEELEREFQKEHEENGMMHDLEAVGNTGALKFEPHEKKKKHVIRHDEE